MPLYNPPSAGGGVTLDDVVDALYPVGAVYVSTLSTNPATLLGRGTWATFGAGKVIVGLDSGDPAFDTSEETGGAGTVTSTGTVSQPTFSGNALGTHLHGAGTYLPSAHAGSAVTDHAAHTHSVTSNVAVAAHAALAAHSHELPWQIPTTTTIRQIAVATFGTGTSRAATAVSAAGVANTTSAAVALSQSVTAGTPDAHGVTNNAVTSANPSATLTHAVTQPSAHTMAGSSEAVSAGTPAGTVTQPNYTGNATSVVQPYIVCYMWKRTA